MARLVHRPRAALPRESADGPSRVDGTASRAGGNWEGNRRHASVQTVGEEERGQSRPGSGRPAARDSQRPEESSQRPSTGREDQASHSASPPSRQRYSRSLPKELTRKPPVRDALPHRSASFSKMSRAELRDFMKKVESSTYRPPTPENKQVETEAVAPRDAVTQTTPQLSRNSSFTWVTECDCSDSDSVSELGLRSFSCSTTTDSDIGPPDTSSGTSSPWSVVLFGGPGSRSSLSLSSAASSGSDWGPAAPGHPDAKIPPALSVPARITPDSGVETVPLTPDPLVKSSSVPTLQRHLSAGGRSAADPMRFVTANGWPLAELQSLEACLWLRAAGFPQYAQMYRENQFPIDWRMVRADHSFLDEDCLQSLFRRLDTLNRCAKTKAVDSVTRHSLPDDDSDPEELCALSASWQFERGNGRWWRAPSSTEFSLAQKCSWPSGDSVFGRDRRSSPDSARRVPGAGGQSGLSEETPSVSGSSSGGSAGLTADGGLRKSLGRSGSDRIKEGARALLRRMDSLKGKKKKKNGGRVATAASDPPTETSPDCSSSSSPVASHQPPSPTSTTTEESSPGGDTSEGSRGSTPKTKHREKGWRILGGHPDRNPTVFPDGWTDATFNRRPIDDCWPAKSRRPPDKYIKERWAEKDPEPAGGRCKKFGHGCVSPAPIFNRTCSLDIDRQKIYDPYLIHSADDTSTRLTNSDPEISDSVETGIYRGRRDSGVGSSLNRTITSNVRCRWHCFPYDPYWSCALESNRVEEKISVDALYAPQLTVLRKLSLLKLTTLMEKYSPSSQTGWNWAVPKFIRGIKTPDYRDKVVFGVPFLVVLRRTGYPLPPSIREAIRWIENTSLDVVGIFRKSGVRSRIQKLRNRNESGLEKVTYRDQQAYDVADLLKQYFRELPEAPLTNKLSETFIGVFQYVPEEHRLDALRAAILLMPDENREVLHILLAFLNKVYRHAGENQMTATNLAVCFAPSLFHLSAPSSASASPRRRKTVVVLDRKELNENRAAYQCLTEMILEYQRLFLVSEDMLSNQHISYLEHCQPATLEEFGRLASKTNSNWKLYIDGCINNMLKEARDRYKEWIPFTRNEGADIAYKKVPDNYPLRLWKIVVEVEAPPVEVLNRILRERHIWDESFIKWRVITRLDKQSEIFQYVCSSMPPQPPRDYCILRSWQTDLPKGTCILIEMSINYSNKPLLINSIQGIVLASRYLIEPCGSGKSRVSYISRIDLCGHSSEWYNKAYGYISSLQMLRLRDSFSLKSEGPETKV